VSVAAGASALDPEAVGKRCEVVCCRAQHVGQIATQIRCGQHPGCCREQFVVAAHAVGQPLLHLDRSDLRGLRGLGTRKVAYDLVEQHQSGHLRG
jgi:hypothetical protein